jgi:hypothetical protein
VKLLHARQVPHYDIQGLDALVWHQHILALQGVLQFIEAHFGFELDDHFEETVFAFAWQRDFDFDLLLKSNQAQ